MRDLVDIPPVWLLAAIAVLWAQSQVFPLGLGLDPGILRAAAWGVGLVGCALIAAAVLAFFQARTTTIPHRMPERLITSGIFARTRNPIYLGDAFILMAAGLWWNAGFVVLLLPLFVWWIDRHFIQTEEQRIRHRFGAEFDKYAEKTRRWL